MKYDWISIQNKKFGCMPHQIIRTLGVEKKAEMKVSREWENNELTYFGRGKKNSNSLCLYKKNFKPQGNCGA
jgi:hypothetical protein